MELGAVDLEPELVEAIVQAARRAGLTVAAWCRRAYEEQLRAREAVSPSAGPPAWGPGPPSSGRDAAGSVDPLRTPSHWSNDTGLILEPSLHGGGQQVAGAPPPPRQLSRRCFCATESIERAVSYSAFRTDFSDKFGVKIMQGGMAGLLSRAVIILDEQGKVLYAEQVPEITTEPNYDAAMAKL